MTEQVSKNWKLFKDKFVEQYKDVPPYIIDYIAIEDILLCHLKGEALEKICETYQLSPEYVTMVVGQFLKVTPRNIALDFNPYMVYNNKEVDKELFLKLVKNRIPEEEGELLYDACVLFELIQEQIEDFYRE